ncbi:Nascent polypeptide-associated complex protein [Candidatus Woesearchaeota archaeon]|nr:Nascent polypeptide-associated complex protein [Candidatus Woesearchaeota archaeon]
MSGMDPRLVKMALKKMGVKQEDIGASRVIIETVDNKKIFINNPQVSKVDMAGNVSFQISGDISEEEFSEEDIRLVMEQTNVSREKAKKALENNSGDIAQAILELKK